MPVEYKVGGRHGLAAHVQLTAQALCLEEMLGQPVREGAIWFSATRRREVVVIDAALREQTCESIDEVRRWLRSDRLPPAPNDARCIECQLLGHCLPAVVADVNHVSAYIKDIVRCVS